MEDKEIIAVRALTEDAARTWKYYKHLKGVHKAVRISQNEFHVLVNNKNIEVRQPLYVTQ